METSQRCQSISKRFPGKCLIATVPKNLSRNENKLKFAPCFNFSLTSDQQQPSLKKNVDICTVSFLTRTYTN